MGTTERRFYVLEGTYMAWAWFMGPVYPLFLLSRGLDVLQAASVLVAYFVVTFVLEVPTGAVADLFGRRASFLLACAIRMVAFGLYYFADGYLDCLVAEAIDALGSTLASGALQAWAVDGIRAEGDERPMDRVFARVQVVQRGMMIAGGVIGGAIADVDIALPWLLASAGFGATGVYAFFTMHETPPATRPTWRSARRGIADTMTSAAAAARADPIVRFLCLITAAFAVAVMPIHFLWPARLEELVDGRSFWLLGWAWALINLAAAAGGVLSDRVTAGLRRERVLIVTTVLRAVGIAIAAQAPSFAVGLGGLLLMEMAFAVSYPAYQAWLNEHIEARLRATVLSIANMSFTIGGAVGLLSLGWLAREANISAAWTTCAVLLIALAPSYLLLARTPAAEPASASSPP